MVDCPALTPYPRACHDSFVIGFDGLDFLTTRIAFLCSCTCVPAH